MTDVKSWATEDPNIIVVGERKISLNKKGREQALQIERLNKWLAQYVAPLSDKLRGQETGDAGVGIGLLSAMELSVDAQFELANIIIGTKDADGNGYPPEFLDNFYEFDWVVDALSRVGHGGAVQRILTAFFTNAV